MKKTIRIGTRGSQLALYQAKKVKATLQALFPDLQVELEIIKTKGDKILDVALSKIGDKGSFTKEIENALIDGTVDLAVHSLKDLPTTLPEGLKLGAVLERGEYRDALVSKNGKKLADLVSGDVVATSSLRRIAGLLKINNQITIKDIRGNVNSRLQKVEDGYCDAMIMAAAGLQRLGLERKTWIYPFASMLRAGVLMSGGTDCPVERLSAMEAIGRGVTRDAPWRGEAIAQGYVESECLSVQEVWDIYTKGSAYSGFAEKRFGTLDTGMQCDFIGLDSDPLLADPRSLETMQPSLVVTGGQVRLDTAPGS